MIIDVLSNAERYFCIHPLFAKAFGYMQSENMVSVKVGNYDIMGDDIRGIVTNSPGRTMEEAISRFECHNEYIDIQLCIDGPEQIGWKPRQKCIRQKGCYNADKDVIFYDEVPDMYFGLTGNQFVIFFPDDVHAPMIGEKDIKKMVIKVKCIL